MLQVLRTYFFLTPPTRHFQRALLLSLSLLMTSLLISCDQEPLVEKATEKSTEVEQQLKTAVDQTSQNLKSKIDELNKSFQDALLASDEFLKQNAGWHEEQIQAALKDIHANEVLFEEAGFELDEISIELSISPKCILNFEQVKTLSSEQQATILQTDMSKLNRLLLKTLFKAYEMNLSPYKINDISIHLSMIPKVRLNLEGTNL